MTLSGTNIGLFPTARCTVGGSSCAFQSSLSILSAIQWSVTSLSDSVPIIFSPVPGLDINVGNVKIINATLRVLKYEAAYSSLGTSLQLSGLDFPDFLISCFCDSTNSRVRRVSLTMLSIPVVSASGFCSFSISVEGLSYPIFSGSLQLPVPFIPESIEPTRVLGNGASLVTIKGSSSSWFVSGASLCRFGSCLNANDARFCSTTSGITSSTGKQIICPVPILNSGFVNVAISFDGLFWAPVLSS